VGYAFFRKKLFRSKAAASPGLGEQDELFGDDFHAASVPVAATERQARVTMVETGFQSSERPEVR
jgi:hypothetical protein